MVEASSEWRWVDADGVESTVDEWELMSSLSSGALPSYTLVWRPGWTQWMPASRVAALAAAVGPKAERAMEPPLDPTLKAPPPPPLDRYRAFRARDLAGVGRKGARDSPRVGGIPAPFDPPTLGRRPMPTLVDEQMPANIRATLRPPAAVPPPPRAMPRAAHVGQAVPDAQEVAALALGQRSEASELTGPLSASARQLPPVAPIAAVQEPEVRYAPTATPEPAEHRAGAVTATLGTTAAASEPEQSAALLALAPRPRMPSISRQTSRLLIAVLATGIAASLLAVAAILLVLYTSRSRGPLPQASTPASSAATPVLRECQLARSARRIAPTIERSVGPELLALPEGKLAMGYAETETSAVGLVLGAESLVAKRVFAQSGTEPVLGVVPLLARDKPEFRVDRRGGPLSSPRSVDRDIVLGSTPAGVVRVSPQQAAPELLWPGASEEITVPRSVLTPAGYAVAFRRGGQRGHVMVGWLDRAGKRASDLGRVSVEGFVGTPAIAANDREILVSVATRPDAEAKWGVALARGAHGELPQGARAFVIPPGGPGVETISPSATGLPGGRWLLQWTEGATGNRQVRVQTLAPDLTPIGAPITLSAVEDNAGQGVIQAVGDRAVSLFIVIKGEARQLWAAALACP